jgi:hypothetical protein
LSRTARSSRTTVNQKTPGFNKTFTRRARVRLPDHHRVRVRLKYAMLDGTRDMEEVLTHDSLYDVHGLTDNKVRALLSSPAPAGAY